MKTPFSRAFLAITGATLLAIPAHAASTDFSDFAGKYKGTYQLTASGGTASGSITTSVKVPRSGRSATIRLRGTVFALGTPLPISGEVRMKSNGKLTTNSPLMGYVAPVATKPSRYKARNGSFKFKVVTRPGATLNGFPFSGKLTYTLRFKRDSLTLEGSGTAGIPAVPVQITVKGKK